MTADVAETRPVLDDDPFDPEVLRDRRPLERLLREAGPMVWLSRYGVWATGRHEQAEAVFRDWETFSSAAGTGMTNTRLTDSWRVPSVILDTDPPEHDRSRLVMSKVLSPTAVRRLRAGFAAEADRLVAELVERGTFDAATDLAEAFPMTVLPDAVGMAQEGREHLLPYSNLNFQAMGPRNALYDEAVVRAGEAKEYVSWQMRREALSDDGFGAEIYAAADAEMLTHDEAALLVRTFLSAGIDTTVYAIGLALHALVENPAQWDRLRADPRIARHVFEETMRHSPSSPVIGRTTTRATEVDGVPLGADEKVLLFLGAANRDPRRWEDPDAFDVTRQASGHLGFGVGLHQCVGQLVARLEAECVLSAVARLVPRLELVGEPVPLVNNWLAGFTSLPVRVVA